MPPLALARSVLMHVCTRPGAPPQDDWVEGLVAAGQAQWLVRAAERTMVAGLLWSALTPAQRSRLPDLCSARLQAIHLATALRWQACRKLIIDSATALAEAGVPVAVLKGAALMLLGVYPDLGQRALGDLDLLVPEERLEEAHVLLGRGLVDAGNRHPQRHLAAIDLEGAAGRIEVHGTAAHQALWPHDGDLFATGRPLTLDGAQFVVLSDSNLWLHLACHGMRHAPHYWPRMAADLARLHGLARWDDAHWRTIWGAARDHGAEGLVLFAAAVAGGMQVPHGLRRAGAADADCDHAAARAREAWGLATGAPVRDYGPWARRWVDEGVRRNRELLEWLCPTRAEVASRLRVPRSLVTAIYPVYPLRRSLRLARCGLAWWAALRWRHFLPAPDEP